MMAESITVGPYGFSKANGHWYPDRETLHANWQDVICEIAATLLDEIAEVRSLVERLQPTLELRPDDPHIVHYRSCDCLGDSNVCCDPTCEEADCVEARQVP